MVAPDRVLSMGQIELFGYLTVCKRMNSGLFKILPSNYVFTNYVHTHTYIYMCVCVCVREQDLALNNPQVFDVL